MPRTSRSSGRKRGGDAAVDYAQEMPVRVIAHTLGIAEQDGDRFRKWIHEVLELGITDNATFMRARTEMQAFFEEEMAKRRACPRDDLITYLVNARSDCRPLSDEHVGGSLRLLLNAGIDTTWSAIGSCLWHLAMHPEDRRRLATDPNLIPIAVARSDCRPLSDEHVGGSLRLLLNAGIDTTWSAIGFCLWHMAMHPEDRRRLATDPNLIPTAVEEFLRAYAPVIMAREIVNETEINGCVFKPGQMVLLSLPAANRDPDKFPNADRVVIDRPKNPHVAFGLGIHRCIGSNLARMEINVALQEWLARIPEFRLDSAIEVKWSEGQVRGPRWLPMLFD